MQLVGLWKDFSRPGRARDIDPTAPLYRNLDLMIEETGPELLMVFAPHDQMPELG
ncbi:MAG: hypothetical protein ABH879_02340 [archaeon]